ncbi:MAG: oligopeptide/dipeptide ABC transporter ATP-binding protein [Nitrospirota bacterium]
MAILEVVDLKKYFPVKTTFLGRDGFLKAVDGVTFSVKEGKVFALVGESGSGKSTVARLVLRLLTPTSGHIYFQGKEIQELRKASLKAYRKSVQIVFQDPFASLNPRMTVFDTISEPLKIHKIVAKSGIKDKATDLMNSVGLDSDILNRYPHEFSGGQRQRICIARALAVAPRLIVADEPLSALDVSIQAQILNILQDLQKRSNISFLFISHDLRVVQYFSDEIAVMYLGKLVEHANTDDLFRNPMHPYTNLLLSSAPKISAPGTEPRPRKSRVEQKGSGARSEVPSPIDVPSGCPFHPRCPEKFDPCDKVVPELRDISGRLVSCHLY